MTPTLEELKAEAKAFKKCQEERDMLLLAAQALLLNYNIGIKKLEDAVRACNG